MNTSTRTIFATFTVLASVATASAFYNPKVGRWLTRDPIGEPGFVTVGGARPAVDYDDSELGISSSKPQREPGDYVFVLNDSVGRVDALGLISFNGCDAGKQAELTAAWNAACDKINDPDFGCCLGDSTFHKLMKRRCTFGNIRFFCRQNGTALCNSNTCAHAWLSIVGGINVGRIVVCYPLSNDCNLLSKPCLLAHELAHIVNASPFEGPNSSAVKAENCCQNQ
jgi:hypothetical protein